MRLTDIFLCTLLSIYSIQATANGRPRGKARALAGCSGAGSCSGDEVSSALMGGSKSNPGIKARFNQAAFTYANSVLGPLLNSEIKKARLPDIRQCIPKASGCLMVYNLNIGRYRCPDRINVRPAAPNKIILQVQNADVGVDGNLGGQISILVPLLLTGIVHVNVHQLSIKVAITINRAANGAPYIHMSSCRLTVGYVDAWIENGGLIGDIVNQQFRRKVSKTIKKMLPKKVCQALPQIINEKLNAKLGQIPQAISLKQMLQMAGLSNLGSTSSTSTSQCASQCKAANPTAAVSAPLPAPAGTTSVGQITYEQKPSADFRRHHRAAGTTNRPIVEKVSTQLIVRTKPSRTVRTSGPQPPRALAPRAKANAASTSPLHIAEGNVCGGCPGTSDKKDPLSSIGDIAKYLDMSKLNDIYLTVQLTNNYATNRDYTIELNGEFSPYGRGGTPFGAFPMYFPPNGGNRMAEALISDFTINSLFYHMHRKGFLAFHVGPETPKIGELLKTTCSEEEDLEDHGVEIDDGDTIRVKRQDDADSLSDLASAFCFGDILPAVREKYPNKKIAIDIKSVKAPSVIFSSRNGGMATLELAVDADISIDDTHESVGTITIAASVEVTVQPKEKMISGSLEITSLKLTDKRGTLGLDQDTLDNLGNLGKELLQKVANDALQKGIPIQMPANSALPITFVNPSFSVVDHALYLQSDFSISPSLLQQLGGGGGGSTCSAAGR
ncbi:hypothetical protein QR680_008083 [Steinernema hermaphroditum]|uniref:Lipid-binding serum glycoprotein C-terminal domain-containing protein n=1 Tax=Steinernema hermaphroditum TaxID=289476 RepID=A0AA39IHG3_9BILA|nr:hypothetical protein QR680_008083 [Steinernema hermaphroditum]